MYNFETTQKWLNFISDLDLDSETKDHYTSQLDLINTLSNKDGLDDFLIKLKNIHDMKHILSDLKLEYNNKKAIFKSETNDLSVNYDFSFKYKEREIVNEDVINQLYSSLPNVEYLNEEIKNELKESKNDICSYTKVKLKSANVLVSSKFYNDDSIEKNLELRISNNWVNTSKDSICKSIMPILNEMLIFSEEEFLAVKKRTKFRYFLHPTTFKSKFGDWESFSEYIGAENLEDVKKVQLKNKNILINDIFNNSLTISELVNLNKEHGINWKKESKAFICFASLPILNEIDNVTYDEFSVKLSKYPYSSLMSMGDILFIFSNWTNFIEYLGVSIKDTKEIPSVNYKTLKKLVKPLKNESISNHVISDHIDLDNIFDFDFEYFDDDNSCENDSDDYADSGICEPDVAEVNSLYTLNTDNTPALSDIQIKLENVEVAEKYYEQDDIANYFKILLNDSLSSDIKNGLHKEKLKKSGIEINSYLYNDLSIQDITNLLKKNNLNWESVLINKDLICYSSMPILNVMPNLNKTSFYTALNKVSTHNYLKVSDISRIFGSWASFLSYLGIREKKDLFLEGSNIKKENKIKLKNSNYFVYEDFKNTLTAKEFLKVLNSKKIKWNMLSKNDIAYASMIILDTLKYVTIKEFNENKPFAGFLPDYIIDLEFGGWLSFSEYIGLEYIENSITKIQQEPSINNKKDIMEKNNQSKLSSKLITNSFFNLFKIGLDYLDEYNDSKAYIENLTDLKEIYNLDPNDFDSSDYKLYPSTLKLYEKFGTDNFNDSLDRFYLHYHKDFKALPLNTRLKRLHNEFKQLGSPKNESEFKKIFFSNGYSKTFIPLVILIDIFGSYNDYLKVLKNWESEQK